MYQLVEVLPYVRWFFWTYKLLVASCLLALVLNIWFSRSLERRRRTNRSFYCIRQGRRGVQRHTANPSNDTARGCVSISEDPPTRTNKNRQKNRHYSPTASNQTRRQPNSIPNREDNLGFTQQQIIDRSPNKQYSQQEQTETVINNTNNPNPVLISQHEVKSEVRFFTPEKECVLREKYDHFICEDDELVCINQEGRVYQDKDGRVFRDKDGRVFRDKDGRVFQDKEVYLFPGYYVPATETRQDEENDETLNEVTWAFDSSPSGFKSKTQSHFVNTETWEAKHAFKKDLTYVNYGNIEDNTVGKEYLKKQADGYPDDRKVDIVNKGRIKKIKKETDKKAPVRKMNRLLSPTVRVTTENKRKKPNKPKLSKQNGRLLSKPSASLLINTTTRQSFTRKAGKLIAMEKSPPQMTLSDNSEHHFEESPLYNNDDRPLSRNRSESNLVKKDSWIWYERPSIENVATRRKKFQSSDPRVAKIAAEIELQDRLNKDIERHGRSLIESSSLSSDRHKIDSLAFIEGLKSNHPVKIPALVPLRHSEAKPFKSSKSVPNLNQTTSVKTNVASPGSIVNGQSHDNCKRSRIVRGASVSDPYQDIDYIRTKPLDAIQNGSDSPWVLKRQIRTASKSPTKSGQHPDMQSINDRLLRMTSQSPEKSSVWKSGTCSSNMTRAPGSFPILSSPSSRSIGTSSWEPARRQRRQSGTSLPERKLPFSSFDGGEQDISNQKPPKRSFSLNPKIESKQRDSSDKFLRKMNEALARCNSTPNVHFDFARSPSRQRSIIREAFSQSELVSWPSGAVEPWQFKSASLLFSTEDSVQIPTDSNPLAEGVIQKEVHGLISNLFSPMISPSPSVHRCASAESASVKRKLGEDKLDNMKRHRSNLEQRSPGPQEQQNKHYNNSTYFEDDDMYFEKSYSDNELPCKRSSPRRKMSALLNKFGNLSSSKKLGSIPGLNSGSSLNSDKHKLSRIPVALPRQSSTSLPGTSVLTLTQSMLSNNSGSQCDSKRSKPNVYSPNYYLRRKRSPNFCKNTSFRKVEKRQIGSPRSKLQLKQSMLDSLKKAYNHVATIPTWQNTQSNIPTVAQWRSRHNQNVTNSKDVPGPTHDSPKMDGSSISSKTWHHFSHSQPGVKTANANHSRRPTVKENEHPDGTTDVCRDENDHQQKNMGASTNNSSNYTPQKQCSNFRSQRGKRQVRGTPYDRMKSKCQIDNVKNIPSRKDCNASENDQRCLEGNHTRALTDEQVCLQPHWQYSAHMLAPFYPAHLGLDKPIYPRGISQAGGCVTDTEMEDSSRFYLKEPNIDTDAEEQIGSLSCKILTKSTDQHNVGILNNYKYETVVEEHILSNISQDKHYMKTHQEPNKTTTACTEVNQPLSLRDTIHSRTRTTITHHNDMYPPVNIHIQHDCCTNSPLQHASTSSSQSSIEQAHISSDLSDGEASEQDTLPPSASDHSVWSCDLSARTGNGRDIVKDDMDPTSFSDSGIATCSMSIAEQSDASISTHADLPSNHHDPMPCLENIERSKASEHVRIRNGVANGENVGLAETSCANRLPFECLETCLSTPLPPGSSDEESEHGSTEISSLHTYLVDEPFNGSETFKPESPTQSVDCVFENKYSYSEHLHLYFEGNESRTTDSLSPQKDETLNSFSKHKVGYAKQEGQASVESTVSNINTESSSSVSCSSYDKIFQVDSIHKHKGDEDGITDQTHNSFKCKLRRIEKGLLKSIEMGLVKQCQRTDTALRSSSFSCTQGSTNVESLPGKDQNGPVDPTRPQSATQLDATTFLKNLKVNGLQSNAKKRNITRTPIKIDRKAAFRELRNKFE